MMEGITNLNLEANNETSSSEIAGRRGLSSSEVSTDDEFDLDLDLELINFSASQPKISLKKLLF